MPNMLRKQELKKYLEGISQDAKLVKFLFTSEEKFVVELRCKAEENLTREQYNKYISEWILKFSKFTSTTWIVRHSFPKIKRLLYRKTYICGRSSFNKKTATDSGTRNQACRAKIDFKFKKINKNTVRNDALLKERLNLCIRIDFIHSHKVTGQEALKYLKCATETDDMIYDYIKNGYLPSMAKAYHELYLFSKYGDDFDKHANGIVKPTLSHIFYLFNKAKKDGKEVLKFDEIVNGKREEIEESGGLLNYPSENTVVVISPCMRRALSALNLDIVLITSTALAQDCVVTMCFVPTNIGAISFACVLHEAQTETAYSQAFFALKLVLENDCYKAIEPKIIAVDNLTEMRLALEAIYSGSKVMISPWSMCNQIWRWLCDGENNVDKRKRHDLMNMFHEMVYAADVDTAHKYYCKLKEEPCAMATLKLSEYVNTVWETRDLFWWPGEHKYIIALSIAIFNEFIRSKCKSFNMISMVDVAINIMDQHFRQIIWSCLNNKDVVKTYTKFLEKSQGVYHGVDVKNVGPNEYKIDRKEEMSKWRITFRTDTLCCECAFGVKGHFCLHLCAILNTSNVDLKIPQVSDGDKSILMEIAGEIDECGYKDDIDEPKDDDNMEAENFEEANDFNEDEQEEISTKHEADDDDYYYLEIKKEIVDRNDPLEEIADFDNEESEAALPQSTGMTDKDSFKDQYEKAVKSINVEFRRMNKYFKENPNASNLDTMLRLARELQKIRPVERVNLNNMIIELNNEGGEPQCSDYD